MEDYELHLMKNPEYYEFSSIERNNTEERRLIETYCILFQSKKENDVINEFKQKYDSVKKELEEENEKKPDKEKKQITGSLIKKMVGKPSFYRKTTVQSFVQIIRIGKYSLMIKRCGLSVGKYLDNHPLYIYRLIHPKTALKILQAIIDDFEEKKKLTEEILNEIMRQNSFMILKRLVNQKKEILQYGIEEYNYLFKGKKTIKLFKKLVNEAEKEIDEWLGEQFEFLMSKRKY